MRYGNTVGPFLDRIADTPPSFDYDVRRRRAETHITIGAGELDYDPVAAELSQAGFDGTVAVEVFAPDVRLSTHSADVVREAFRKTG